MHLILVQVVTVIIYVIQQYKWYNMWNMVQYTLMLITLGNMVHYNNEYNIVLDS